MRASAGVRSALRALQSTQANTQFVQLDWPPCARGTTWSIVNSSPPGCFATVLASHLVSLEHVAATERNRLRRQLIELRKCDHFRHAELLTDRLNERFVAIRHQLAPIAPVKQLVVHWIDNLGGVVPQQDQRTSDRGHIDRLPVAVQYQRRTLERWAQAHEVLSVDPGLRMFTSISPCEMKSESVE